MCARREVLLDGFQRSGLSRKEFASVESIQGKTDYELSPAFLADQFRHDDEQVLAGHRIVTERVSFAIAREWTDFGAPNPCQRVDGSTARLDLHSLCDLVALLEVLAARSREGRLAK